MVSLEDAIKVLRNKNRIFLTGKSGTGKSYLSNKLGHKVLELDSVVLKLMKKYKMERPVIFTQVYKNKGSEKLMSDFKKRVSNFIKRNKGKKILIEGAISDTDLIQELFDDSFVKVFLYPSSKKRYYNRLLQRYHKNPKSLPFVVKNESELESELNKITKKMMDGSKDRYKTFKKKFDMYKVLV